MSVIGPRPQLVRDLVFMSKEERKRHTVKPGDGILTSLKIMEVMMARKKKLSELAEGNIYVECGGGFTGVSGGFVA